MSIPGGRAVGLPSFVEVSARRAEHLARRVARSESKSGLNRSALRDSQIDIPLVRRFNRDLLRAVALSRASFAAAAAAAAAAAPPPAAAGEEEEEEEEDDDDDASGFMPQFYDNDDDNDDDDDDDEMGAPAAAAAAAAPAAAAAAPVAPQGPRRPGRPKGTGTFVYQRPEAQNEWWSVREAQWASASQGDLYRFSNVARAQEQGQSRAPACQRCVSLGHRDCCVFKVGDRCGRCLWDKAIKGRCV